MSIVASCILHVPLDRAHVVEQIDKYLVEKGHYRFADVTEHAGGEKAMQCLVYLGAFNHLDIDALVAFVRSCDWLTDEEGGDHSYMMPPQLFILGEQEDVFTERLDFMTWYDAQEETK